MQSGKHSTMSHHSVINIPSIPAFSTQLADFFIVQTMMMTIYENVTFMSLTAMVVHVADFLQDGDSSLKKWILKNSSRLYIKKSLM